MLVNAMRDHCAEFGLVAAQGVRNVGKLIKQVGQADPSTLPEITKAAMILLAEQLKSLVMQIQALNRRLLAWHRQGQASQRLANSRTDAGR